MNVPAFRQALLRWFQAGHRALPWRQTRDPYAIWLSEIMLQQTRAAAAIPYYHRFLAQFPDAAALARAPESEVLAAWSGLGYYHRARNLRRAAQSIAEAGSFPQNYAAIRALPGVGDYTAAAVASIAFSLPHAVLDGNVLRVIARLTADPGDIGAGTTRKRFQQTATEWLDPAHPGAFNQAVMELGATICLPRNPQCLLCPVAQFCEARQTGTQTQFPVKAPKAAPRTDTAELLLLERPGKLAMKQRASDASRMADFWELPDAADFPATLPRTALGTFTHTIVNTRWTVRLFRAKLKNSKLPEGVQWIAQEQLAKLPNTTVTRKALSLSRAAD